MSARKGRGGEKQMVPEAEFRSYYGRPVVREAVWGPDIPAYLFLGGLAGASSALAAGAQLSGYPELARAAKAGAAGAISLSVVALVHDLGRPARFLNMLRVFKVTSPMSVGSWILSAYAPAALAAAASAVTGKLPRAGLAATAGAGVLGPAVAAYTAVLLSNTAVPAWHEAQRELPYLFVGSAATAAGGLGLLVIAPERAGPAVRLALLGAVTELYSERALAWRLGSTAEPYQTGKSGALMRTGQVLAAGGAALAFLTARRFGAGGCGGVVPSGGNGRRNRAASALSGAMLLAGSAVTRFGVFEAGRASARDPKYTVGPQRERIRQRAGPPT